MILSFSQKFPWGDKTYFIEKIWSSDADFYKDGERAVFFIQYLDRFKKSWDTEVEASKPKMHTIRADSKNRWKEGNKIHFLINNRSKNSFQFAPVVECTGVQDIIIEKDAGESFMVNIPDENGSRWLEYDEIDLLAINDGFDELGDFFRFFDETHFKKYNTNVFEGKIIHWTNLRY